MNRMQNTMRLHSRLALNCKIYLVSSSVFVLSLERELWTWTKMPGLNGKRLARMFLEAGRAVHTTKVRSRRGWKNQGVILKNTSPNHVWIHISKMEMATSMFLFLIWKKKKYFFSNSIYRWQHISHTKQELFILNLVSL